MVKYDFVAGDTASVYGPRTLEDSGTSAALDLTGSTVKLLIYQNRGYIADISSTAPPDVTQAMAIVNASSGIVQYQFLATDLVSGIMYLIIQVLSASGQVLTETDPQAFVVR
jgi:hypothetical protein